MTKDATGEVKAEGQAAAGQVDDNKGDAQQDAKTDDTKQDQTTTVPLSALQKLREELQQTKEQNVLYQTQLNVMRGTGQQPMQQQAAQPAHAEADPFEGLEEDDILTVADVKKALKSMPKGGSGGQDVNSLRAEIAKLKLTQQDPDYETTIRTYLPEIINSNPLIVETIKQSSDPLSAALSFAKMHPRYQALHTQNNAENSQGGTLIDEIDRIIANAEKPGSASQASGSGAISGASRFKDMTPEQIEAHKQKVMSGG